MSDNRYFYRDLPQLKNFSQAVQTRLHTELPEDWWVVIADVAGSTKAIEAGEYKKVNTVGVACIAAMVNLDRRIDTPFVFGGDGATLAIPACLVEQAIVALRGAQKLAREDFNLELRAGMIEVASLVNEGFWVNVARVHVSENVSQATFSGRGWEEAERRIKSASNSGLLRVSEDGSPAVADFEGFECRWQGVPSFNGHKLSLLVAAMSDNADINLQTYRDVTDKINEIYGEVDNYHPLRPSSLRMSFAPSSIIHEWRVKSAQRSWWFGLIYFCKIYLMNIAGIYLFASKANGQNSHWAQYRDEIIENSDFRKFDGILRMVIDGSDAQANQLEQYLLEKYRLGMLVYGMYKSREALVTCLVQSYTDNHMHFVDGSDGGYAIAAIGLKHQLNALKQDKTVD